MNRTTLLQERRMQTFHDVPGHWQARCATRSASSPAMTKYECRLPITGSPINGGSSSCRLTASRQSGTSTRGKSRISAGRAGGRQSRVRRM